MKARMKMVCTALAVVGLASGAMAGRGSWRLIEKRTGSQEQSGSGTAEEFCRRGDRLYYGRGCERDLKIGEMLFCVLKIFVIVAE